jgi:hypothetical protein
MEIKDYLHLYLGCTLDNGNILNAVHVDGSLETLYRGHLINYWTPEEAKELKLVLRPLSDIKFHEKQEFIETCGLEQEDIDCLILSTVNPFENTYGTAHLTNVIQWAKGVTYLLSKHFDIFGLIDAGLAIDATPLPTDKEVNTKAPGG